MHCCRRGRRTPRGVLSSSARISRTSAWGASGWGCAHGCIASPGGRGPSIRVRTSAVCVPAQPGRWRASGAACIACSRALFPEKYTPPPPPPPPHLGACLRGAPCHLGWLPSASRTSRFVRFSSTAPLVAVPVPPSVLSSQQASHHVVRH
jgi:hypothetical protein